MTMNPKKPTNPLDRLLHAGLKGILKEADKLIDDLMSPEEMPNNEPPPIIVEVDKPRQ